MPVLLAGRGSAHPGVLQPHERRPVLARRLRPRARQVRGRCARPVQLRRRIPGRRPRADRGARRGGRRHRPVQHERGQAHLLDEQLPRRLLRSAGRKRRERRRSFPAGPCLGPDSYPAEAPDAPRPVRPEHRARRGHRIAQVRTTGTSAGPPCPRTARSCSDIRGSAIELQMEVDPKLASMFEVDVLRSANGEERTRICVFSRRGYKYREPFPDDVRSNLVMSTILSNPVRYESVVTIDTSFASTLPDALSRPPESAPVLIEPDEPVRLRIFVDRSVVEVFVNERQCVAARVYPGGRGQHRRLASVSGPGIGAALARLLADEKHLRIAAASGEVRLCSSTCSCIRVRSRSSCDPAQAGLMPSTRRRLRQLRSFPRERESSSKQCTTRTCAQFAIHCHPAFGSLFDPGCAFMGISSPSCMSGQPLDRRR